MTFPRRSGAFHRRQGRDRALCLQLPPGSCLRVLLSLAASLTLLGCGVGPQTTSSAPTAVITGHVHGGMQAVVGATVQLYAAGTTGNGSASTPLLSPPVLTDATGAFTLTGTFTCPSASTQVYLVARGGNPGFSTSVNNPALVLVAALGSCGRFSMASTSSAELNEVTTVAAAYALAAFAASSDHLGASATNTIGIANAFLDAQLLANPATGLAPQLAANLATETGKLYALADALAPCVNSTGAGSPCSLLFSAATPASGSPPADVFTAALDIVRNPGSQVAAVFNLVSSTPPWVTSLTAAPADWTMSLSVTGGGLAEPTELAVDAGGNVWVTNYGHSSASGLVAFSPQGAPFSGTPFGAGVQTDAYGLTLDRNGDIWISSYDNVSSGGGLGSVAKFLGSESSTPGALVGQFTDASLSQPEALAADPAGSGTVLAANYHTGTVTFFGLNGQVQKVLGGNANGPNAVTSDTAGGAWVGNQGNHELIRFKADGTSTSVTCCNAVQSVKLDLHGNVWATNFYGVGNPAVYTFSEVAADGTPRITEQTGGGLYAPGGAAIDAGGNFWVANYYAASGIYGSLTAIAGNDNSAAAGTPLSPSTGLGADAKMALPFAVAPDPSGNLWISVRNGNSLRMFFGLATPTATPAGPLPAAP